MTTTSATVYGYFWTPFDATKDIAACENFCSKTSSDGWAGEI